MGLKKRRLTKGQAVDIIQSIRDIVEKGEGRKTKPQVASIRSRLKEAVAFRSAGSMRMSLNRLPPIPDAGR